MWLTAEQREMGRRNFLKAAATLPAVGAFAVTATNTGPVKVGVVGTGVEGRILMSTMDPKYTYIQAICDIRPDNRKEAEWYITNPSAWNINPDVEVYEDYDEMLDQADIEAVVCATPLNFHGPMGIKALKAGKHFFTEKTMAYTVEECEEMIRLAEQNGLNLQVGHQRFYNPLYWDAYRMVQEGMLGNVYHVRTLWHRNMDWNYWLHVNQRKYMFELEEFDPTPWGYRDMNHLVNWRWYNDTSHGLWTELCSHQIAITNWLFGDRAPSRVLASGTRSKTDRDIADYYAVQPPEKRERKNYEEDDREYNDHVYAMFQYDNDKTIQFSSIQSNSFDNYYEQIMGTYATIIITKENETYLFWEPGWDEATAKEAAQGQLSTKVEMTQEDAAGSAFAAHVSEQATGGGGATGMSPYEPYGWELEGFAHTIRTGAPNLCDGYRGLYATQACMAALESTKTGSWVEIPKSPVVKV